MAAGELGCYAQGQTDRTKRASSSYATVPRLPGEGKQALDENLSAYHSIWSWSWSAVRVVLPHWDVNSKTWAVPRDATIRPSDSSLSQQSPVYGGVVSGRELPCKIGLVAIIW